MEDQKDDIERVEDKDQEEDKEVETEDDMEEEKDKENEENDEIEEEEDKEQERGEEGEEEEEEGIYSSDDEDDELLASIIKLKEVRILMVQAKFDLLYLHHIETNFNSSGFGISPTTDMIQIMCNGTGIAENRMVKLEQAVD